MSVIQLYPGSVDWFPFYSSPQHLFVFVRSRFWVLPFWSTGKLSL